VTQSEFWRWFKEGEPELSAIANTAAVVDRIYEVLQRVDNRLAIEVSEPDSTTVRDVIFSANGFSDLFGLAEELVSAAPELPEWRFIALKPARGFDFLYQQDGNTLSPSKWSFLALRDEGNELGLRLFIPGRRAVISDAVLQTVIETGVGERRFSEIHHLEYTQSPDALSHGSWVQLPALPEFLKWQASRI
jgi:hypothetical protein